MNTYNKASIVYISLGDKIGINNCDINVQEARSLGEKAMFEQSLEAKASFTWLLHLSPGRHHGREW